MLCSRCGKEIPASKDGFTSGYAQDSKGNHYCYPCVAQLDREEMISTGSSDRLPLYLTKSDGKWKITNWPGSLEFTPIVVWTGNHNIGGKATFARFIGPDGKVWSGKQIGAWNDIFHAERTKIKIEDALL